MSRSRIVGVIGLLLLSLTQTSCVVESEHPLIAPDKATLDERLFGQWKSVEGENTMHQFIGRPAGIADCPAGLVVLHSATISRPKHEIFWDAQPLYGFATKVGKDDYFHVIGLGSDADAQRLTDWKKVDIKGYLLIKYAVSGDSVTHWRMDLAATAKAIEDGKLKGVVKRGKNKDNTENKTVESVILKDSTENLRRFLENGGNTSLFNDKGKTVLTRVKW